MCSESASTVNKLDELSYDLTVPDNVPNPRESLLTILPMNSHLVTRNHSSEVVQRHWMIRGGFQEDEKILG